MGRKRVLASGGLSVVQPIAYQRAFVTIAYALPALGAALLFGVGTPLAKLLLGASSPRMMAGLLYAGSGLGLLLYRHAIRADRVTLHNTD